MTPQPALDRVLAQSVALQNMRELGRQHEPRLAAVDVIVAHRVSHRVCEHTQQVVGVFCVRGGVERAQSADDSYRTAIARKSAIDMMRVPPILELLLGATDGILSGLAQPIA